MLLALSRASVLPELIGDRFLRNRSGQWIDLATGGLAIVAVHSIEDEWNLVEARLGDELYAPAERSRLLLDYGRIGVRGWFEARAATRAVSGTATEHARVIAGPTGCSKPAGMVAFADVAPPCSSD